MDGTPFRDRADAGRALGELLARELEGDDTIVLGLPRGGLPVAFEVARALDAELDAFLVRKLGVPWHPELAMGAIATGGIRVLNLPVVEQLDIAEDAIAAVAAQEQRELERRELLYREGRPPPSVSGRTAVLVDDGLATGATMRAAALALRELDPGRLLVAVPVASRQACEEIGDAVDAIVCARTPEPFRAVGAWYDDFAPPSQEELLDLLRGAREDVPARG